MNPFFSTSVQALVLVFVVVLAFLILTYLFNYLELPHLLSEDRVVSKITLSVLSFILIVIVSFVSFYSIVISFDELMSFINNFTN